MSEGLTIGRYQVTYPVIQGGMGVRVSGYRLAGHVALNGGVGIVASAGLGLGDETFNGSNYFTADCHALKEAHNRLWVQQALLATILGE